jgi:2-methylisocitrate lyase-like PEP mutase family enzyme
MSQSEQKPADAFRALHAPGHLLILPNAWDAGSARLIEECGAPAIATTSAGVAWARGYPDGHGLPTDTLLAAVTEIARVVRVPLSVDAEGGYSDDPAAVGELAFRLAEAGASGVNLEDGAGTPELLCAKIAAAKRGAARAGVDLFVNARTDVVLRGLVPAERAVDEIVRRAALYRDAGCDGIFAPKVVASDAARTIVAAIAPLPLNLLVMPGVPAADELRALGVRRLSAGSMLAADALGLVRRLTTTFLADGRSEPLFDGAIEYGTINGLLATR